VHEAAVKVIAALASAIFRLQLFRALPQFRQRAGFWSERLRVGLGLRLKMLTVIVVVDRLFDPWSPFVPLQSRFLLWRNEKGRPQAAFKCGHRD
jgi:hypothetical protein